MRTFIFAILTIFSTVVFADSLPPSSNINTELPHKEIRPASVTHYPKKERSRSRHGNHRLFDGAITVLFIIFFLLFLLVILGARKTDVIMNVLFNLVLIVVVVAILYWFYRFWGYRII
jgi:Flp pilus assembly protein TadB